METLVSETGFSESAVNKAARKLTSVQLWEAESHGTMKPTKDFV